MGRDRIREQAAAWVVRLAESPDEREAFERWRDLDVQNEIAFEQELANWERLDQVAAIRPLMAEPDPDLLLRTRFDASPEFIPMAAPRAVTRRWAAAAGLLLAVTGGATGAYLALSSSAAYGTGIGEYKQVRLADGTTVDLNTNSRIVVHYGRELRSVRLVRGEALFHIVADARPFQLISTDMQLDAREADLLVRVDQGQARVIIKNGVALAQPAAAQGHASTVTALDGNSDAILSARGAQIAKIAPGEIDRLLAWRRGALAFNGQTLREVASEFNRYNARQIVVGDDVTGAIRIGGYFQAGDADGFAHSVARTFQVNLSTDEDGRLVLSRRG